MITHPTVFILGAGASNPYGFSTGAELKNNIQQLNVEKLIESVNNTKLTSNDWKVTLIPHKSILRDFFEDLKRSGANSVDAFLENKQRYEMLGKALISLELIKSEIEDELYVQAGNWYRYLYHNYLKEPFEDFPDNNVSFITFNYDRSLETFLFNAIKSDYDKTEEEVVSVLDSIPIIHLHGTLGDLPFKSSKNSRKYENKITKENIEICERNIKIVHEVNSEDPEFMKAHDLISKAYYVWFLGFSYDKRNVHRLKLPDLLENAKVVLGTTYGFRKGEIMNIANLLNGRISMGYFRQELDTLSYLQEFANCLE